MNKGITILILAAVLGAMGLVLYSHSGSRPDAAPEVSEARPEPTPPTVISFPESGPASPLQAPQGDSGGLSRIEPPITGAQPGQTVATEPKPVTVGPDGERRPPRDPAPKEPKPAPEKKTEPPKQENAKKPEDGKKAEPPAQSGTPGLTVWEKPPAEEKKAPAAKPQTPPQAAGPATGSATAQTKPQPVPQPPAAEQRPATDPLSPAELGQSGAHTLTAISLSPSGQGMKLRIEADSAFTCKSFVLTAPDRLVIDLPGSWKGMKAPSVPANDLVKSVRLGQQPGGPRLVLDLASPPGNHTVERLGSAVEIQVR